jgi:hypothetical protein
MWDHIEYALQLNQLREWVPNLEIDVEISLLIQAAMFCECRNILCLEQTLD